MGNGEGYGGVNGSLFFEELFHCFDRPWEGAENLAAVGCDDNVVLEPHSSDLHVFFDFSGVEIWQFLGVLKSFLYHEIDEVDSGFDGDAYSLLQHSPCSQFAQSSQLTSLWTFSISSKIMDLQPK